MTPVLRNYSHRVKFSGFLSPDQAVLPTISELNVGL